MNGIRVLDVTSETVKLSKAAPLGVYDNRPAGMASVTDGRGAIVLHTTEGSNSRPFLRCCHGVSIHKLLDHDGTIIKMVDEQYRAWHAGVSRWGGRANWNDFSIGYEIEHMQGGARITDGQYEAVAQSIAFDTARFHIFDYWVRFHREIAIPRGRKADPTDYDAARVWSRVAEIRANWPLAEWGIPLWYRPARDLEAALAVPLSQQAPKVA